VSVTGSRGRAIGGLGSERVTLSELWYNFVFGSKSVSWEVNVDIDDSVDVSNRVKPRSIIIFVAILLIGAVFTWGLIIIPAVILWIIAYIICNNEIASARLGSSKFKKNFAFRFFGTSFGDFQHLFYYQDDLRSEMLAAISRELEIRTLVSALEPVTLTDVDNDLKAEETREFFKADFGRTRRGTNVTLLLSLSSIGKVQSIRWWVLAGGYVDLDKKFNFIAYAPLTLWFWIVPYLRKNYDIASRVRTIYAAYYNDLDIITQVRCLHDTVFSAMVEELEKHGIDTSDIKAQRMQVMNLTISGGRVNMGNVVQGAMNRVQATVGGNQ